MILKSGVWSVMQSLGMDELIATKTSYNSPFRKVMPRSQAYGHEKFEYCLSSQLTMVLDRRDYSQWRIFSGGLRVNTKIFQHVPVNPYRFEMIDIGANVGGYSVLFSREIDVENFNVHLFEPNPLIIPGLEENVRRLELSNLAVNAYLNPFALGDKEARLPLKVNENHSGISTFVKTRREFTKSIDVDVVTLDSYVRQRSLSHIDFIKLDVESYEPSVLQGARETLATLRPAIYFEYQKDWFDNYTDEDIMELIYFLNAQGYTFYREARDGSLHRFPMTVNSLREFRHLNILAVTKPA
jgi:FkbM family methyltransferase